MKKIEGMTERDLLAIKGKELDKEEIFIWFNVSRAGWVHDGDIKKPHAELFGLCSNGYFDCQRILCYPNLSQILAQQLVQKLEDRNIRKIGWVVSSASINSIRFAFAVATILKAVHIPIVEIETKDREALWRTIPSRAKVLQIEDMIITGLKVQKIRQLINVKNQNEVEFLPLVGALVHRPKKLEEEPAKKVVGLIEREIWEVRSEECLLCAAGSKRCNPKTQWLELIGIG